MSLLSYSLSSSKRVYVDSKHRTTIKRSMQYSVTKGNRTLAPSCRPCIFSLANLATKASFLARIKTQSRLNVTFQIIRPERMFSFKYAMCFVDNDESYFDNVDYLDKIFIVEALRSQASGKSPFRYAMCFVDSDESYFDSVDHLDKTLVVEANKLSPS